MVYTFLCEKSGYSLKMVTLGDKSRAKLIRHYYNFFAIEAPLALCDFFFKCRIFTKFKDRLQVALCPSHIG